MAKEETNEEIIKALGQEQEEIDRKVNKLLNSFNYYNDIVEELGNMFVEYEINESVICYSTLENYEDIVSTDFNIDYVVKVIYNGDTFQFTAENFEDKDTKFKVRVRNNKKNSETIYTANNLNVVKSDIIKWLISM